MSEKLPLTYRAIQQKLFALGFVIQRAKGSHVAFVHPETRRRAVVPRHSGDIPKGTVRSIIRESGVDLDTFLNA